jgi:hypothetical protein
MVSVSHFKYFLSTVKVIPHTIFFLEHLNV